jgi:hypothetical protein
LHMAGMLARAEMGQFVHRVKICFALCVVDCSTRFLIASSRWNRQAGRHVLLVRLSHVTDWEEGGRTSSRAAARIFSKEVAEGPRQVLIARREVRRSPVWGF